MTASISTFANGFGTWYALVPKDATNPEREAEVAIWREVQDREAPRVLPFPTVIRVELHDTETHLAYAEDDWSGEREVPNDPITPAIRKAFGAADRNRPALDLLDKIEALENEYSALTQRSAENDRTYRGVTYSQVGMTRMPVGLDVDDVFASVFLEDGTDPDRLDENDTHFWQATQDAIMSALDDAGHSEEHYEPALVAEDAADAADGIVSVNA